MTTLWAFGVCLLVIGLIYFEKTAILYILSTLGVTALLMIVAFSDLKHEDENSQPMGQAGDAARVAGRAK